MDDVTTELRELSTVLLDVLQRLSALSERLCVAESPPGRFYTVAEAHAALQDTLGEIAVRTVWNWVESGKLRSVKIGHFRRIPAESLAEFLSGADHG